MSYPDEKQSENNPLVCLQLSAPCQTKPEPYGSYVANTFFAEDSDWLLTYLPVYPGVHRVLLAGLHFWTYRCVNVRTRPCSVPTVFSICTV